jgi:hypothetical protein
MSKICFLSRKSGLEVFSNNVHGEIFLAKTEQAEQQQVSSCSLQAAAAGMRSV